MGVTARRVQPCEVNFLLLPVDVGDTAATCPPRTMKTTCRGISTSKWSGGVENLGVGLCAEASRVSVGPSAAPVRSNPSTFWNAVIPCLVAPSKTPSTGNNKKFTSQGWTRRAVTPNGQFQISYKRNGWRNAPLGRLYRPAYFNGGIALHGSTSIPTSPASHGCVRLPMAFADYILDNAPVGMVVYVHGGPSGENPQPILDEPPLPAPPAPLPAPIPVPEPVPPPVPDDPGTVPPGGNGLLQGLLPQA